MPIEKPTGKSGVDMLEVSSEALVKLAEMVAAQGGENSGIRIAVMGGGGQGPGLGLVVDAPGENDVVIDQHGIALIIDRSLIEYCRSISIDFTSGSAGRCGGASGSGFVIRPEQPINV
jgi:Fe-S cluster assembly iron-binding protein IscA